MDSPTIGILGPASLAGLRRFLADGCQADIPMASGGTPVTQIAAELLRRGRRVVVFTLEPGIAAGRTLEGDRLRIRIGPYTAHRGRVYFARERRYLLDAIRQERPDVLSAHWTYEFALAAIASGIPHVVTAHDAPWTILGYNPIPYRIVRTAMAYHASRLTRRMVAVSPYVARHLQRYGFHSRPIEVIPNGLPASPTPGGGRREADGVKRFAGIFSGGWESFRNGPTLLRAFAITRRRVPEATLAMIGEQCEPGGPADRWADRHGLRAGVEFMGHRPHAEMMDTLARRVDVLVHPSLEESFGMPLIEAATVGVPTIGGRASGAVPWVLDGGACGVLVDVRSPNALAEAMVDLAVDDARRCALAANARAMVHDRFNIAAVVDRYEAIFAELCAAPSTGRK